MQMVLSVMTLITAIWCIDMKLSISARIVLLVILTQVAMCGTWMCFILASLWIEVGHGLHPYVSLPLAGVLVLVPYIVHSLWFESDRSSDDYEPIDLPLKPIDSGSSGFPNRKTGIYHPNHLDYIRKETDRIMRMPDDMEDR